MIINLLPLENDVDIGEPSGLMIPSYPFITPVSINAYYLKGVLLTLTSDCKIPTCTVLSDWIGLVTCAIEYPYVTVVATGPIQSGDLHLVDITIPSLCGIMGNISILHNSLRDTVPIVAGVLSTTLQPLPNLQKQSIVSLETANEYYMQNNMEMAHHIINVLANKRKMIVNAIFFVTNIEISLMIQLKDLYGSYVSSDISVNIYIQGYLSCPVYS